MKFVPQEIRDAVPESTPQDWRQHERGGGWVYKTANVTDTAHVGLGAIVFGNASVSDNASVSGNASVFGNASVSGHAQVSGGAQVYGTAQVSGGAQVSGEAVVLGDVWTSSPLYIQGSRHSITLCSLTEISIGWYVGDFAYWNTHYKAIGAANDYTKFEIAEYGHHIRTCIAHAKSLARRKADSERRGLKV